MHEPIPQALEFIKAIVSYAVTSAQECGCPLRRSIARVYEAIGFQFRSDPPQSDPPQVVRELARLLD